MTQRHVRFRRFGSLVATLSLATATGACGSVEDTATAGNSSGPQAAGSAGYPVTVQNCGREVTFDRAPERNVTGWVTGTELLIELGAQDRIVGLYNTSAFGKPRAQYARAYAELSVLSDTAPSREQLLATDPDLIYADGNYLFDGQQLPTVDDLEASGINVLVLSGFCDDGGASQVLDVHADLAALGPALGVQEDAGALGASVEERLAAIEPDNRQTPLAMINVFDGAVFVYDGVYTDIATRAGAVNVYAGTLPEGTYFGELSIEDLTQRNPATLVYLLSGPETPQATASYLRASFPTLAAVQQDRVIYLPSEDSSNLRAVDGVEQLAEELRSLG